MVIDGDGDLDPLGECDVVSEGVGEKVPVCSTVVDPVPECVRENETSCEKLRETENVLLESIVTVLVSVGVKVIVPEKDWESSKVVVLLCWMLRRSESDKVISGDTVNDVVRVELRDDDRSLVVECVGDEDMVYELC